MDRLDRAPRASVDVLRGARVGVVTDDWEAARALRHALEPYGVATAWLGAKGRREVPKLLTVDAVVVCGGRLESLRATLRQQLRTRWSELLAARGLPVGTLERRLWVQGLAQRLAELLAARQRLRAVLASGAERTIRHCPAGPLWLLETLALAGGCTRIHMTSARATARVVFWNGCFVDASFEPRRGTMRLRADALSAALTMDDARVRVVRHGPPPELSELAPVEDALAEAVRWCGEIAEDLPTAHLLVPERRRQRGTLPKGVVARSKSVETARAGPSHLGTLEPEDAAEDVVATPARTAGASEGEGDPSGAHAPLQPSRTRRVRWLSAPEDDTQVWVERAEDADVEPPSWEEDTLSDTRVAGKPVVGEDDEAGPARAEASRVVDERGEPGAARKPGTERERSPSAASEAGAPAQAAASAEAATSSPIAAPAEAATSSPTGLVPARAEPTPRATVAQTAAAGEDEAPTAARADPGRRVGATTADLPVEEELAIRREQAEVRDLTVAGLDRRPAFGLAALALLGLGVGTAALLGPRASEGSAPVATPPPAAGPPTARLDLTLEAPAGDERGERQEAAAPSAAEPGRPSAPPAAELEPEESVYAISPQEEARDRAEAYRLHARARQDAEAGRTARAKVLATRALRLAPTSRRIRRLVDWLREAPEAAYPRRSLARREGDATEREVGASSEGDHAEVEATTRAEAVPADGETDHHGAEASGAPMGEPAASAPDVVASAGGDDAAALGTAPSAPASEPREVTRAASAPAAGGDATAEGPRTAREEPPATGDDEPGAGEDARATDEDAGGEDSSAGASGEEPPGAADGGAPS